MAARKSRKIRIRRDQRQRMETAIEHLIAACDALDGDDADLEEDDYGGGNVEDEPHDSDFDDEPSLGSFDRITDQRNSYKQRPAVNGDFYFPGEDREADPSESEPSLGSVAASVNDNQENWAAGTRNDTEEQHDAEHDEAEDDRGPNPLSLNPG